MEDAFKVKEEVPWVTVLTGLVSGTSFETALVFWTEVALELFSAFSEDVPLFSLAPHCSQKLLEAGFFALQLGQVFISAIPNSLVIDAKSL
jgi:hypothetical protein